jgi:hypothetical protein
LTLETRGLVPAQNVGLNDEHAFVSLPFLGANKRLYKRLLHQLAGLSVSPSVGPSVGPHIASPQEISLQVEVALLFSVNHSGKVIILKIK